MDIIDKIRKKSYVKECFYKDANCSSKIIRAHSIQNNRVLNKISDSGEVLYPSFNFNSPELGVILERKGKKSASTFTGFCSFHDNLLFRPIDTQDYIKGNKEQEFLFAYRSLAKEYHAKKVSLNVLISSLEEIGNKEFDSVNFVNFRTITSLNQTVLNGLILIKNLFNDLIEKREFDMLKTSVFEFHEEYHIAVSSVLTPQSDLLGKTINKFDKIDKDVRFYRFLYLTIFPQNGKTYILLSFLKKHKKDFASLINQIQKCSIQKRKIIFSNLLAINVENFAVSPKVWEELPEDKKIQFMNLFKETAFAEGDSMISLKEINLFI